MDRSDIFINVLYLSAFFGVVMFLSILIIFFQREKKLKKDSGADENVNPESGVIIEDDSEPFFFDDSEDTQQEEEIPVINKTENIIKPIVLTDGEEKKHKFKVKKAWK